MATVIIIGTAALALLAAKHKGVSGIGARSRTSEDEKPIMEMFYWGKDRMGRDTYVGRKAGAAEIVIIDAANNFKDNDAENTDELYKAYPYNEPYYHEPDYHIGDRYDFYLSKRTYQEQLDWEDRRNADYRFAYES